MENQILETISPIKNLSKKSPAAETSLNHVSKTSASNIDLLFVNEITKQLIAKNKLMIISKLLRNPNKEILINPLMKHRLYLMAN